MDVVLATRSFALPGGSETYILTLAEQLQRLAHEVVIFTEETGPLSEFATQRGADIRTRLASLPARCDALVVQDGAVAYELAGRFPDTGQLFRAASDLHDLQLPPALPGLVTGVVVLSDRVERRVREFAGTRAVHRLRQPVDTERFAPVDAPAANPRRALLLGNHLRGHQLEAMQAALASHGIESDIAGLTGTPSMTPERSIWEADFVVAKGRAAIEGMACGKPVFIYDQFGGDGWVTPERYPAMEADNFAGQSRPPVATASELKDELAGYDPAMGTVNRELAITHHGARRHAAEICSLLVEGHPPAGLEGAPLRELARLVRLQWLTELRGSAFQEAARRAGENAAHAEGKAAELSAELSRVSAELAVTRDQLEAVTSELNRHRALVSTRRVRFGQTLGKIADVARRPQGSR